MDPLTAEDIARLIAHPEDDERIDEVRTIKFNMGTSKGYVPFEVCIAPDAGVYIRTVINGHLVDAAIFTPWEECSEDGTVLYETPEFRLCVDVNEMGGEALFIDDLGAIVDREVNKANG